MQQHDAAFFFCRRRGELLPVPPEADCLAEDPGVAQHASGDHDAVAAGLVHHAHGVRRRKDVPVADDRDGHRFFHLCDDVPVGFTGIVLFSGPAVDGDGRTPCRLRCLRSFGRHDVVRIPAFSDLDRHRLVRRLADRVGDVVQAVQILEERRALTVLDDLGHRASHIDIKERILPAAEPGGGLPHHIRLAAEDLVADRPLFGTNQQELFGLAVLIQQALPADHLRTGQCRAHLRENAAVRTVRDACQRRRDEWIVECQRSDLHVAPAAPVPRGRLSYFVCVSCSSPSGEVASRSFLRLFLFF